MHNGYCANGNVCLGRFDNATLVAGSDKNLTQNVDSKLYEDRNSAGNNKCAYICDSGYTYIRNGGNPQCAICEDGTYNSNTKTCTISAQCPTGYKSKDGECLRIGNCLLPRSTTIANGRPTNSSWNYFPWNTSQYINAQGNADFSKVFDKIRPLGDDAEWKCYEADSSHQVTENSVCEFKCIEGYRCSNLARCQKKSNDSNENKCDFSTKLLKGGDTSYTNPDKDNHIFKKVDIDSLNEYMINKEPGCYEACKTGYQEKNINNTTYCWQKCAENQYFSSTFGCTSCPKGEKPGVYSKDFESYTKCVYACDSSVCGNERCGWSDETNGCLLNKTQATCPAGWNKGDNNTCWKCLPGTTWNNQDKKCE